MAEFSNETIYELVKAFKEENKKEHWEISNHLDKLNGQVAKNTSYRNKALGVVATLGFLGISSLFGLIALWVKVLST